MLQVQSLPYLHEKRGVGVPALLSKPRTHCQRASQSDRIAPPKMTDEAARVSPKPIIVLGADHAGFRTKDAIADALRGEGYRVEDFGTSSEESVDYPDYARRVGERVASHADELGILVCGTGIGMSIAANKVEGVRAAVAHDLATARLAREHNDANVLTLGARVVDNTAAIQIVREFLAAQFAGGRHQRRVDKITELDETRVPHRS